MFVNFVVEKVQSRIGFGQPTFSKEGRRIFQDGLNCGAFVISEAKIFEEFSKIHAARESHPYGESSKSCGPGALDERLRFRHVKKGRGQKRFFKPFGVHPSFGEVGLIRKEVGHLSQDPFGKRLGIRTKKPFSLSRKRSFRSVHRSDCYGLAPFVSKYTEIPQKNRESLRGRGRFSADGSFFRPIWQAHGTARSARGGLGRNPG